MKREATDKDIAEAMTICSAVVKEYRTQDQLSIYANLIGGVLRLFCIRTEKKDVYDIIDQLREELREEIEEMY